MHLCKGYDNVAQALTRTGPTLSDKLPSHVEIHQGRCHWTVASSPFISLKQLASTITRKAGGLDLFKAQRVVHVTIIEACPA